MRIVEYVSPNSVYILVIREAFGHFMTREECWLVTAECRFCIFIQRTPTAPPKWNGMESSTAVACAPLARARPLLGITASPFSGLPMGWDIASKTKTTGGGEEDLR